MNSATDTGTKLVIGGDSAVGKTCLLLKVNDECIVNGTKQNLNLSYYAGNNNNNKIKIKINNNNKNCSKPT